MARWIDNGEISYELEKLFEWLNEEYNLKKNSLSQKKKKKTHTHTQHTLAEGKIPVEQSRLIKILATTKENIDPPKRE